MEISGEDIPQNNMKGWRDKMRSRVEIEVDGKQIFAVNDGASITVLDEMNDEVHRVTDEELLEYNLNPTEQISMHLNMIIDTHDIKKKDEEKISGRKTIHLRATAKDDETSLFDCQDIWIDKEK